MFSRFHRRTPSNPTSPAEAPHSWSDTHLPQHDPAHNHRTQDGLPPDYSTAISPPVFLPPIERVSSLPQESMQDYTKTGDIMRARAHNQDLRLHKQESLNAQLRARDNQAYTNHQRIQHLGSTRPESAGQAAPARNTGSEFTKTQAGSSHDPQSRTRQQELGYSFVSAADIQMNSSGTGGRRQMGGKVPSPPPVPEKSVSTFEPVAPARSGKARLNLLNPMSLLARRRTAQAVPQLLPEAMVSSRTGGKYNETFDPRIRGTVVHDFSAPRPKKNVSHNDIKQAPTGGPRQHHYPRSPNQQTQSATTDENTGSPWSGGNHTPVFTENFDEEQYPAAGPHVRKAADLELPLPKPPYAKGAQRLPDSMTITEGNSQGLAVDADLSAQSSDSEPPPPVPPKINPPVIEGTKCSSVDPSSTSPKSVTPAATRGSFRNLSEGSTKDSVNLGIPKHMKSTSSRFSFDMIGAAEQERLLEDRHRQKALEKKSPVRADDPYGDDLGDDFDYDGMDDDDGLEERIPGINADLEEEDYGEGLEGGILGVNMGQEEQPGEEFMNDSMMVGFRFQSSASETPITLDSPAITETPRDANGDVIGFARTKDSPCIPQNTTPQIHPPRKSSISSRSQPIAPIVTGLGLQGIDARPTLETNIQGFAEDDFPRASIPDDDDLYFDDGIIQDENIDDAVEFDESIFDKIDTNQYGRPLKTLSTRSTLRSPPNRSTEISPSSKTVTGPERTGEGQTEVPQDFLSRNSMPLNGSHAPQPSICDPILPFKAPSQDLTHSTLAAYQSALAAAAHAAAAAGAFRRSSTVSSLSPPDAQSQPGLIPDTSQHTSSHLEPFSPAYDDLGDYDKDDFDYDDALSDDPIIAAANAEALAHDADGFYGQEFGFYSAPAPSTQYANGGYFGPRGAEGVIRSQSGRVLSREPNLTPITERSELSNRNSFMSIPNMLGSANILSPGLSQLAGLMSASDYEYDGDMTLSSLMKLRRGAWGGSQASLHSSNGSPREGSPAGGWPPSAVAVAGGVYAPNGNGNGKSTESGTATLNGNAGLHSRQNSGFSTVSESPGEIAETRPFSSSGLSSAPTSPTLMLRGAANHVFPDSADSATKLMVTSPRAEDVNGLGLGVGAGTGTAGAGGGERDREHMTRKHRHTGSAESISYLKEGDPVSGERWILERRRTAESGEVEVLMREVVSGGRI